MKSTYKMWLSIIGVLIFLASATFLYLHFRIVTQPTPQLFQPEEQMLTQAMHPEIAVLAENTSTLAASTTFSLNVCTTATSSDNEYTCFIDYYRNLTLTQGVDAAFADIKARYAKIPYIQSECHPFMHIIGQAAYQLYPDISEAYLHGDSFCWSGYYHGILEGLAFKIGKVHFPPQINTICANIPGKNTYGFDYYNCVHGLGHGIMELYDDDVPTSLTICDDLTGRWEQESCYSGVFMENIVADSHDHDSKYLSSTDLMYPCDSVADTYKDICYMGQTSYALEKSNYDFTKVSPLCVNVGDPYRDTCFQSLGRDAAGDNQNNSNQIQATCQIPGVASDITNCMIGAVKELISFFHSDVQAKTFCGLWDDNNKNTCLDTEKSYYSLF